jgi:hypothetical protein
MTTAITATADAATGPAAPKRRPGRPPTGLDTVQVCVRLRRDQVEQIRAIVDEDIPLALTRSTSSILRAAVDDFFAQ